MPKKTFHSIANSVRAFGNLITGKSAKYGYLEGEFRSPIKERNDFELEFILDVFAKKHFDPARYLSSEYARVRGIDHTHKIVEKLDKCVSKTSVSLKELVQDNYVDFISCFAQIHGIEAFFTKDGCNSYIEKVLQRFATVLRYQDALIFDLQHEKWTQSIQKQNDYEKHIYDENNVRVIPGNDIVDSPSALLDDIGAMCDERKWNEAISILNMITQDIYRGEYNYLKPKTRKQIKKKIVQLRKIIYSEVGKLLNMNACNKLYRRRLTVYILRIGIHKCRYFNRGITLYLECKLKELNHNISNIELRGDLKAYVTDLTILVFHAIRELIQEFNEILIESGNVHHKDSMSYLIVFILRNILSLYVDRFKSHVFEATKCDISLKLIGECLRISFGHLNKLKWSGLCLEMYLNHYLFEMVRDTVNIYFEDEINETLHALSNDTFDIKQISLLATATGHTPQHRATIHPHSHNPHIPTRQSDSHEPTKPRDAAHRRSTSYLKYESVTVGVMGMTDVYDMNGGENDNNHNNNIKTVIYITSSAQMVYKYIRKCLTESRSLLSFSYYPIMTQQLLSIFIENIINYVQTYCSHVTQILRQLKDSPDTSASCKEAQCVGMISNVYYIANDLLYRTNDRLLKQCRFQKMERIEIFQNKLTILYKEQFKYFARIISMEWMQSILQFGDDIDTEGVIPKYYCGLSAYDNYDNEKEYITKPSHAWVALIERIAMTNQVCCKYLHEKNAIKITERIVNCIVNHLKNDRYWINDERSSLSLQKHGSLAMDIPSTTRTHTRHITHYGLQQFIFDIKFFAISTDTYLGDESKAMLHNTIINNAITLYCDLNNHSLQLTPGVVMKSNQHYQATINQFLSYSPHLDLNHQCVYKEGSI